jgi:hypothetical protein
MAHPGGAPLAPAAAPAPPTLSGLTWGAHPEPSLRATALGLLSALPLLDPLPLSMAEEALASILRDAPAASAPHALVGMGSDAAAQVPDASASCGNKAPDNPSTWVPAAFAPLNPAPPTTSLVFAVMEIVKRSYGGATPPPGSPLLHSLLDSPEAFERALHSEDIDTHELALDLLALLLEGAPPSAWADISRLAFRGAGGDSRTPGYTDNPAADFAGAADGDRDRACFLFQSSFLRKNHHELFELAQANTSFVDGITDDLEQVEVVMLFAKLSSEPDSLCFKCQLAKDESIELGVAAEAFLIKGAWFFAAMLMSLFVGHAAYDVHFWTRAWGGGMLFGIQRSAGRSREWRTGTKGAFKLCMHRAALGYSRSLRSAEGVGAGSANKPGAMVLAGEALRMSTAGGRDELKLHHVSLPACPRCSRPLIGHTCAAYLSTPGIFAVASTRTCSHSDCKIEGAMVPYGSALWFEAFHALFDLARANGPAALGFQRFTGRLPGARLKGDMLIKTTVEQYREQGLLLVNFMGDVENTFGTWSCAWGAMCTCGFAQLDDASKMLYRVKGKWSIVNYRTKRGPRDLKTKWGPRAFFKVLDKHLKILAAAKASAAAAAAAAAAAE